MILDEATAEALAKGWAAVHEGRFRSAAQVFAPYTVSSGPAMPEALAGDLLARLAAGEAVFFTPRFDETCTLARQQSPLCAAALSLAAGLAAAADWRRAEAERHLSDALAAADAEADERWHGPAPALLRQMIQVARVTVASAYGPCDEPPPRGRDADPVLVVEAHLGLGERDLSQANVAAQRAANLVQVEGARPSLRARLAYLRAQVLMGDWLLDQLDAKGVTARLMKFDEALPETRKLAGADWDEASQHLVAAAHCLTARFKLMGEDAETARGLMVRAVPLVVRPAGQPMTARDLARLSAALTLRAQAWKETGELRDALRDAHQATVLWSHAIESKDAEPPRRAFCSAARASALKAKSLAALGDAEGAAEAEREAGLLRQRAEMRLDG